MTILFEHSVFGWVALVAAVLNLIRPHLLLLSIGLAAAAFGIVLHNAALAGLAAGLLILSLARPGPVDRRRIAPNASSKPHSQSDCQFAKLSLNAI